MSNGKIKQKVTQRYWKVQRWMFEKDQRIDIYHANIMAIIYGYTHTKKHKCFVTNQQFADILRCSERTVAGKIKDLVNWKVIDTHTDRKGASHTTRHMTFTFTIEEEGSARDTQPTPIGNANPAEGSANDSLGNANGSLGSARDAHNTEDNTKDKTEENKGSSSGSYDAQLKIKKTVNNVMEFIANKGKEIGTFTASNLKERIEEGIANKENVGWIVSYRYSPECFSKYNFNKLLKEYRNRNTP